MQKEDISDTENDDGSFEFKLVTKLGRLSIDNSSDSEEDLELYGTSSRVIGLIMLLVTLFFPVGVITAIHNQSYQPPFFYSGLWLVENLGSFWVLFRPLQMFAYWWITIPLCTFNFLYLRQVVRYFQGNTSRDISLMLGLLSVLAPTTISLTLWVSYGFHLLIIPIPIQFAIGVYLIFRFREPEVISPWEGLYLDWSWWTRLRHSPDDTSNEVINLSNLLREHDADWLEGYDD